MRGHDSVKRRYYAAVAFALIGCGGTAAPLPAESPAPPPVSESEPPPAVIVQEYHKKVDPLCEQNRGEVQAAKKDLATAVEERKAWFAAHCRKHKNLWVCDNGMTTDEETSDAERRSRTRIGLANSYLRTHDCLD